MSIWRGGAPSHLFPHSNPNVSRTAPYSRFSCYADRQRLASVGGEGIWARAMRLLDTETGHFVEKDPQNTKYAILSHTWDREEQTCKQLRKIQKRHPLCLHPTNSPHTGQSTPLTFVSSRFVLVVHAHLCVTNTATHVRECSMYCGKFIY